MGFRIQIVGKHRKWVRNQVGKLTVWSTGYAFCGDLYLNETQLGLWLARGFKGADNVHQFAGLNGGWAAVIEAGDEVHLAVDRSRSIPLFYCARPESPDVVVSDSATELIDSCGLNSIRDAAAIEFMLSTFVSGRDTLFHDLYEVEPGYLTTISCKNASSSITNQSYFSYFPKEPIPRSDAERKEQLKGILHRVFKRYALQLRDKPLVLPLSGGIDSRMIGYMLRKYGCNNIIAYTYGADGNPQNEIARQVADALDIPWHFVRYDRGCWAKSFSDSRIAAYWAYASNAKSSPHMQDFPALLALEEKLGSLEGMTFLPGHVGDAWASEFIVNNLDDPFPHGPAQFHSPYLLIDNDECFSAVAYRYLNLWPVPKDSWRLDEFKEIQKSVQHQISRNAEQSSNDPQFKFTEWVLRNRTACWITNACRSFEFFGGESVMTLGDNEIVDFLRELTVDQLYRRRLYQQTTQEMLEDTDSERLNGVQIMSGVRSAKTWKKFVLGLTRRLGVYRFLEHQRKLRSVEQSLAIDTWFTKGKSAARTTIGEAVSTYDLVNHLPREAAKLVKPYLNHPVYSIECNGILAAVVLATYCKRSVEKPKRDSQ